VFTILSWHFSLQKTAINRARINDHGAAYALIPLAYATSLRPRLVLRRRDPVSSRKTNPSNSVSSAKTSALSPVMDGDNRHAAECLNAL
jgi:hypothetical protein